MLPSNAQATTMHCSFPRREFQKAFALVSQVAPSRAPKEILQNVKLSLAADGSATLAATDLDSQITVTLPEAVSQDGAGAELLPVQKFGSILRESTAENIEIDSRNRDAGSGAVIVRCGSSRYTLCSASPDEFPALGNWDGDRYIEITPDGLRTAIRRTIYATDAESSRFMLGGLWIEPNEQEGKLDVVATDGRRMSWMQIAAKAFAGTESSAIPSGIIPARSAKVVGAMLESAENARIAIRANDVLLQTEHCLFQCRQLDGRFPQWRQIIPPDEQTGRAPAPIRVSYAAATLGAAVRQAAITTDMESRGLNLSFEPGTLTIQSSRTELGESEIKLDANYDGPEAMARIDHRYLTDVCNCLGAEDQVIVAIVDGRTSVVIRSDDGFTSVIMPMALDHAEAA